MGGLCRVLLARGLSAEHEPCGFTERYRKWCKRHRCSFSISKAAEFHAEAQDLIAMLMHGVGDFLEPQLMAELGDVTRFTHRNVITANAGVDPGANQSGTKEYLASLEEI